MACGMLNMKEMYERAGQEIADMFGLLIVLVLSE
jgi:hypothetical protein